MRQRLNGLSRYVRVKYAIIHSVRKAKKLRSKNRFGSSSLPCFVSTVFNLQITIGQQKARQSNVKNHGKSPLYFCSKREYRRNEARRRLIVTVTRPKSPARPEKNTDRGCRYRGGIKAHRRLVRVESAAAINLLARTSLPASLPRSLCRCR